jgi:amino-acid N-acetyltransferase
MDLNRILAVTFSGLRPEEESAVKDLIDACQLSTQDLTSEMLRNFIVARKGDRVVGVIGLEICGQHALLRSLAVAENFRRQGIAARLTNFIARYAVSHGIQKIYLLTMTAKDFFAKQGYLESDRSQAPAGIQDTREFKDLCPDIAVCMVRELKI